MIRGHRAAAVVAVLVAACAVACFERGGARRRDGGAGAGAASADAAASAVHGAGATSAAGAESETAGDPSGPRDPDATITVALEAEPAHLDPLVGADAVVQRISMGDLYQGLLSAPSPLAPPRPCLASSYEVADGGRRWRFTLRTGVRWHDGRDFAVTDVLATLALLAPGSGAESYLAADFDDLVAATSPVAGVVEISFAAMRPGRAEAFARLPILPRDATVAKGAVVVMGDATDVTAAPAWLALTRGRAGRRPVGTGPLRFVDWRPGERIRLERWDGYWGEPAGPRRLDYAIEPDRAAALRALAAGAVDLVVQIPSDEADSFAAAHREVRIARYRLPAYLAAVYQLRRGPTADVRVRRALTMLLDRAGLAAALFGGRAEVISGPYLPDSPGADPAVAPWPFDPTAARAALAEAGHAGAAVTVLVPSESRTTARIADIWAADARGALALAIEPVPYAELLARVRAGRFTAALMSFTGGRDLDLWPRFHSSGADNWGGLADAEVDRLLVAIRAEPDDDARAGLERALHRRLHELEPYGFVTSDARVALVRTDIGGAGVGGSVPRGAALWRAAAAAARPLR